MAVVCNSCNYANEDGVTICASCGKPPDAVVQPDRVGMACIAGGILTPPLITYFVKGPQELMSYWVGTLFMSILVAFVVGAYGRGFKVRNWNLFAKTFVVASTLFVLVQVNADPKNKAQRQKERQERAIHDAAYGPR